MSRPGYLVKELAELSGVTVRTLHHYDHIGLLEPRGRTDAGYRLYDEGDVLRLQQIVIARDLGMSLAQIRRMLDDPDLDRTSALIEHRERLSREIERHRDRVKSIDRALAAMEGECVMDPNEIFDGFDPKEHEDETRERWGETESYKEAARRTKRYSPDDWKKINAENDTILTALVGQLEAGAEPGGDAAIELAEAHRRHIDRWYYPCSLRMHAGLAEMYVQDERFRASFDKHAAGLAAFLAEAIRVNQARENGV